MYAEILAEHINIPIEIHRLKTGDFLISDNSVIIERKTIFDFAASIIDGRIFTQFDRLKKYPHAYIVITGSKKELEEKSEINYHSMLATEAYLAVNGVSVIHEEDLDDAAYLIGKIFEKSAKLQWMNDGKPKEKCKAKKKRIRKTVKNL